MGFFDSLMGKSQQRDIQAANGRAEGYLATGRNEATGAITQGRDRALNQLMPYQQQGRQGSDLYGNAVGLNGGDAQRQAYGTYSASPFLQAQQGASDNALMSLFKKYNAQGMGNSGMSRLAVSRAAGEREAANQGDWLNRIQGIGSQGAQFANTAAGLEQGTGQYLADLNSGYGQQMAGNTINYGNAMAANRGTGVNNLIKLGGLAVSAATGMPIGMGGGGSTTPGTAANGGWTTTTKPASWWGA